MLIRSVLPLFAITASPGTFTLEDAATNCQLQQNKDCTAKHPCMSAVCRARWMQVADIAPSILPVFVSVNSHGLPCQQRASNSHRVRNRDARVTMHGAQSTFPEGLLPSRRVSPSPRCHSPFSPMVRWPQGALGIPVHTAPHTRPAVWKECVSGVMPSPSG